MICRRSFFSDNMDLTLLDCFEQYIGSMLSSNQISSECRSYQMQARWSYKNSADTASQVSKETRETVVSLVVAQTLVDLGHTQAW